MRHKRIKGRAKACAAAALKAPQDKRMNTRTGILLLYLRLASLGFVLFRSVGLQLLDELERGVGCVVLQKAGRETESSKQFILRNTPTDNNLGELSRARIWKSWYFFSSPIEIRIRTRVRKR